MSEQQRSDTPQEGGAAARASRVLPCPYCGALQAPDSLVCDTCSGLFEPLSRQATQNAMGPWAIRDEARPFHPGCSYETLRKLVERGRIAFDTVLRGPSTRQCWTFARFTPGVAHLLGVCHNCGGRAKPEEYMCASCGAVFEVERDRQRLGLSPVRMLPGEAPPETVASSTLLERATADERQALDVARRTAVERDDEEEGARSLRSASLDISGAAGAASRATVDVGPASSRGAPWWLVVALLAVVMGLGAGLAAALLTG